MKKLLAFIFLFLITIYSFAQNIGINNTGASPNPSAILDVDASPLNDKGILLPRISLVATNNPLPVNTPATSLLVYNTVTASTGSTAVTPGYYYWDGSQWVKLGSGSWLLNGNVGTNSIANFLGTTDAQDLVFRTNATENMRIANANGNIGVAINTPLARLHLHNDFGVNNLENPILILEQNGINPNNGCSIQFKNDGAGYNSAIAGLDDGGTDGRLEFRTSDDNIVTNTSLTTADTKMTILQNGNIGIGTTNPTAVVHSKGFTFKLGETRDFNLNPLGGVILESNGSNLFLTPPQDDNGVVAVLDGNSGGAITFESRSKGFINSYSNFATSVSNPLVLQTSITNNAIGNVGIGTGFPSEQLEIGNNGQLSLMASTGSIDPGDILFKNGDGTNKARIWSDPANTQGLCLNGLGTATSQMYIQSSGNVGINTTTPAYKLDVNGSIAGVGAYINTSDKRKKKNIMPLSISGINVVKKLNPVSFEWNEVIDNGMKGIQMGFIAQEIETILPTMVITANNSEQSKSIKYNELFPVLVKAIQEQQLQIEQDKKNIETLLEKQEELVKQIKHLETIINK